MWFALVVLASAATALQRRTWTLEEFDKSELSILIPETRVLKALPVVALQAHAHFPELVVQLFYGLENEQFVHEEPTLRDLREQGSLVLTELPLNYSSGPLPAERYSSLLKSAEFWEAAITPKILLVQTDAWLCNAAREGIKPFLQYDYVGAPWGHPVICSRGGNGGFSIRDRDAMVRVVKSAAMDYTDLTLPEDLFFCKYSNLLNLPSNEEAAGFSREEKLHNLPPGTDPAKVVGVHKLIDDDGSGIGYTDAEVISFVEHCPGISIMRGNMGQPDTSPDWEQSEELVRFWTANISEKIVLTQDDVDADGPVSVNISAIPEAMVLAP